MIRAEKRSAVAAGLEACARPVTVVPDLCGLAAGRDPLLRTVAAAARATVIACHPRAVRWLFHWAGAPLDPARAEVLDVRAESAETILAAITTDTAGADGRPPISRDSEQESDADGFWRPWFPVIDRDRCTNCRQCLEFCLFGVYEADAAGRVTVARPAQCKNNCPSCARMCPHLAIMFPKIEEESPVSGTLDDAAQAAGKVRLTREQLFGGRALDTLRARQQRPRLLKHEGD